MRRKMVALATVGLLALGACGGDGGSDTEAASASGDKASATPSAASEAINAAQSCEELVAAAKPLFTDLFQGLVDDTKELSAEDLATVATDVESSGLIQDFITAIERDGAALEKKGGELGCSEEDAQRAMCEAVTQIDAKGSVMAETMISGMKAECV